MGNFTAFRTCSVVLKNEVTASGALKENLARWRCEEITTTRPGFTSKQEVIELAALQKYRNAHLGETFCGRFGPV